MNDEDTNDVNENLNAETSADSAKKSIVPAKYAGKYKDGGSDALAEFINDQCSGKDGFEYPAFFLLCRNNIAGNLTEEKIAHYEGLVAEKAHGSQGRARMTLRNMLATICRKQGHLIGLDGEQHEINIPKPAVSGAAAKAKQEQADDADVGEEAA
jgi:hypothetical protein